MMANRGGVRKMKIETWMVTAFGVVVAAAVALVVNYQNRKQARQIELFRNDPSVGLMPPPHPWVAFLKKNWYHPWYVGGMIYFLCRWIIESGQHSYHAGESAATFVLYLSSYNFLLASQVTSLQNDTAHKASKFWAYTMIGFWQSSMTSKRTACCRMTPMRRLKPHV
jgi:hypothetical protein